MKPRILKIDPHDIDHALIKEAADVIRNRGLVAFPTETVYGLGANALDPDSAIKIFDAKKRPLDDPLIVHIPDKEEVALLTASVPDKAWKLIDRFWPGPLTLIMEKSGKIPDIVTTGLDTVAVRMPSNKIAGALIRSAGVPIAAPSANLFGRPSPTTATHVIDDLGCSVDMVIDGGRTEIGVESTVVEFHGSDLVVLRPGGIPVEELEKVAGKVHVYTEEDVIERSPGKYPKHYAPEAKVVLSGNSPGQVAATLSMAKGFQEQGINVGIMAKKEHSADYDGFNVKILGPAGNGAACAENLFHVLREFDHEDVDMIIAEAIEEKGLGLAVMNRLRKAAGGE